MEAPDDDYFLLPEKVLQFGTGVLLRGLPDYFIDKANKKKIFNGRVVIIKSTETGGADAFEKQDSLYTLCVRGIENGKNVDENIINASISRVIAAKNNWQEVLKCAANEDMQIVISNTTEVGLTLVKENVHASPPESFPGKLLAFLYQRYQVFNGDTSKGMVIIPTELIPNNAGKLLSILRELAIHNNLEAAFITWLENSNHFCNSLVDRIVPGKLNSIEHKKTETQNGYEDDLMIMAEPYRLWAIESSNEKVKDILSFAKTDKGVVIVLDITIFRELKLRLLNGSHTLSCGLAHLAGFTTVKEAMNDKLFESYIKDLMLAEIAPSITTNNLSIAQANDFAAKVLDRYRNPYIEHQWLSITMQYSSKMHMRNIPTLKNYVKRFNHVPEHISFGFAAYLLFMKPVAIRDNKYFGEANGKEYIINDDKAAYYYEIWKSNDIDAIVKNVLSDQKLWGDDLTMINGFETNIKKYLRRLISHGAKKALEEINAINK